MKILVDGDSCPIISQTTAIAKEFNLKLLIVKNHHHNLTNDYGEIISVESTQDSADYFIVNNSNPGDIVVTQDYGLGAMALAKKAKVITPNGLIINNSNIDSLLHQRFISSEMRRQKRSFGYKNKKRTKEQDRSFTRSLLLLIEN